MFNMSRWFQNQVAPLAPAAGGNVNPLSLTSTQLADGIIAELRNAHLDRNKWYRYTEILFDRAINPSKTPTIPLWHTIEDTPENLLRHVMEATDEDVELGMSPVRDYVERLVRDVMRANQTGYKKGNNAFGLLDIPTPNDFKQMNEVIKAKNQRTDETQDKIDFSFDVITSAMGIAVGILSALPSDTKANDTTASQSTIYSDGKKMTALVLGAAITLMGGIRQAVDKYLTKKVPLLQVPDEEDTAKDLEPPTVTAPKHALLDTDNDKYLEPHRVAGHKHGILDDDEDDGANVFPHSSAPIPQSGAPAPIASTTTASHAGPSFPSLHKYVQMAPMAPVGPPVALFNPNMEKASANVVQFSHPIGDGSIHPSAAKSTASSSKSVASSQRRARAPLVKQYYS